MSTILSLPDTVSLVFLIISGEGETSFFSPLLVSSLIDILLNECHYRIPFTYHAHAGITAVTPVACWKSVKLYLPSVSMVKSLGSFFILLTTHPGRDTRHESVMITCKDIDRCSGQRILHVCSQWKFESRIVRKSLLPFKTLIIFLLFMSVKVIKTSHMVKKFFDIYSEFSGNWNNRKC